MNTVFADTFFFLAILNPADQHHQAASEFAQINRVAYVTTAWVLTEVGDALCRVETREIFSEFISRLQRNVSVKIVPATQILFNQAVQLYSQRLDKEWSVTDCASFVVMEQEQISEALTGDRHFEQAGFVALLK